MKTYVKLISTEYEQLVAAWHFCWLHMPDRKFRKLLHKILNKAMPGGDRRKANTPGGFFDFVRTVKDVFCLDPEITKWPTAWALDRNGWLVVCLKAWAKKVRVRPRTITRYFRILEEKGLLERKCVKDVEGRFVHMIRFRWDNYLRFSRGEDPSNWIIEGKKERKVQTRGYGEMPSIFVRKKANSGTSHSDIDVSVITSDSNPVAVPVVTASVLSSEVGKEIQPGAGISSSESKFPEVYEILSEAYAFDWTQKQKERLARWVNHVMPIYRLTPDMARLIIRTDFMQLPDLDVLLKFWPVWAKKWHQSELEEKVWDSRIILNEARELTQAGIKFLSQKAKEQLRAARAWLAIGACNGVSYEHVYA